MRSIPGWTAGSRATTGGREAVAGPAAAAGAVRGRGLLPAAGGRAAGPGLHRQCGADPRPARPSSPASAFRSGKAKRSTMRRWLAEHGFQVRRLAGRRFSRGRATPCSAATRSLPATASAATRPRLREIGATAGLPRHFPGAGRSPLLSPRHVFLPAGRRHGDLLSAGLGRLRPQGAGGIDPAADRRERRRGAGTSPATPWCWVGR